MSVLQIGFIVATVVALSIGQILFKLAANVFANSSVGMLDIVFNVKLICALFVYFIATVMWLIVLKNTPLRMAYPFVAMAFFIVPVLSHFILGETLSWNTFLGGGLIAAGVIVSVLQ